MTLIGTPKAIWTISQALPEKYKDFKLETTTLIYMNMADGWTVEDCDNVIYIVDENDFKPWEIK